MKDIEREALIWSSLCGFSNKKLLFFYSKIEEFTRFYLSGDIKDLSSPLWEVSLLNELKEAKCKNISEKYHTLESMHIQLLVLEDDFYPEELALSEDPPVVLYTIGKIELLEKNLVGIVGARKHTNYGSRVCKDLVSSLMNYDVTIVSGMALGIDTIAHKTTLEHEGCTIAVLGNGIDTYYPRSNYTLWNDIKNKGLILSEYPPGTPAYAGNFPQRNRIIAYLCKSLLVIEAKEKSGSLITARVAAESGKDVFAVPGNIDSIYSKGTNRLISDGAFPLVDFSSFLLRYPNLKQKFSFKENFIQEDLGDDEKKVFEMIASGVQKIDLLNYHLPMDTSVILACLTMLELKGYITGVDNDNLILSNNKNR